jgi:hypothetical protein
MEHPARFTMQEDRERILHGGGGAALQLSVGVVVMLG